MAAGLFVAINLKPLRLFHTFDPLPKAAPTTSLLFTPLRSSRRRRCHGTLLRRRTPRMTTSFTVCVLMEDLEKDFQIEAETADEDAEKPSSTNNSVDYEILSARMAEKLARKKSERFTYLVAAVMSSFGIMSMAVMAVYYRFSWKMEAGGEWKQQQLNNFDEKKKEIRNAIKNMISTETSPKEGSFLEEANFKVGRYSAEERKEKISKYRAKRSQRNFNKTIKYACRKTLADNRPRIRGRFARNDESGENPKVPCSARDEDEDEFWFEGLHEEQDDTSVRGEQYLKGYGGPQLQHQYYGF